MSAALLLRRAGALRPVQGDGAAFGKGASDEEELAAALALSLDLTGDGAGAAAPAGEVGTAGGGRGGRAQEEGDDRPAPPPAAADPVGAAVTLLLRQQEARREAALGVLRRLLGNFCREPMNQKFHTVPLGNSKIKDAIVRVAGAMELLLAAGFVQEGASLTITMATIHVTLPRARAALAALESSFEKVSVQCWDGDNLSGGVAVQGQGAEGRIVVRPPQLGESVLEGPTIPGFGASYIPLVTTTVTLTGVQTAMGLRRLTAEGYLNEQINELRKERDKALTGADHVGIVGPDGKTYVVRRTPEQIAAAMDTAIGEQGVDREGRVRVGVLRALLYQLPYPSGVTGDFMQLYCDSCGNRICENCRDAGKVGAAVWEYCPDAVKVIPLDRDVAQAVRTPLRSLFAGCGVPHNLGRWSPVGFDGDSGRVGTRVRHQSRSVPGLWCWENKAESAGSRFTWAEPSQAEVEEEIIRHKDPLVQSVYHRGLITVQVRQQSTEPQPGSGGQVVRLPALREVEVEGDGHCQFRAIAVHVHGDQSRHPEVRRAVCAHLRARQDALGGGRDELFAEMLADMESGHDRVTGATTWGNEYTLLAAADLFRREIKVLTSRGNIHCYGPQQGAPQRTDWLALREVPGFEHYDCLVAAGAAAGAVYGLEPENCPQQ